MGSDSGVELFLREVLVLMNEGHLLLVQPTLTPAGERKYGYFVRVYCYKTRQETFATDHISTSVCVSEHVRTCPSRRVRSESAANRSPLTRFPSPTLP